MINRSWHCRFPNCGEPELPVVTREDTATVSCGKRCWWPDFCGDEGHRGDRGTAMYKSCMSAEIVQLWTLSDTCTARMRGGDEVAKLVQRYCSRRRHATKEVAEGPGLALERTINSIWGAGVGLVAPKLGVIKDVPDSGCGPLQTCR